MCIHVHTLAYFACSCIVSCVIWLVLALWSPLSQFKYNLDLFHIWWLCLLKINLLKFYIEKNSSLAGHRQELPLYLRKLRFSPFYSDSLRFLQEEALWQKYNRIWTTYHGKGGGGFSDLNPKVLGKFFLNLILVLLKKKSC